MQTSQSEQVFRPHNYLEDLRKTGNFKKGTSYIDRIAHSKDIDDERKRFIIENESRRLEEKLK